MTIPRRRDNDRKPATPDGSIFVLAIRLILDAWFRPPASPKAMRDDESHGVAGFSWLGCIPKWVSFSRMVRRETPSQRAALA